MEQLGAMQITATTPARRYFDVAGAAAYLGRTPEAIYKAVARRQIPFRRLGKKLVFDTVELDRYMHALEGVDAGEATARLMHNGTVENMQTKGLT